MTATRLGLIGLALGLGALTSGLIWYALTPPPDPQAYAPGGIALGVDTFLIAIGALWTLAGGIIAVAGRAARPHRASGGG